jgi:hypothetical protein
MATSQLRDERTIADLVKAFVSLELEMTNDAEAEYRRLVKQHCVCLELTVRSAWTEAGPLIDAEIARLRQSFHAGNIH